MALYKVQLTSFYGHDMEAAIKIQHKVYNFDSGWEISEDDNPVYVGQTAMFPFDTHYPKDGPTWIASGDLIPASSEEHIESRGIPHQIKLSSINIVDQIKLMTQWYWDR